MTGLTGKDSAYAAIRNLPDPEIEIGEHHGDRCTGGPRFSQDSVGQWIAECVYGDFEVTGCETQREAGARFYGGEDASLYGAMGTGMLALDLVDRLAARAKKLRVEATELQTIERDLTRAEENILTLTTAKLSLLSEFVDPDTGELR